uniref:Ovule protein n=1 Tax=Steinernema glaseri TaxID=37863 RepID=A0A1I8A276_9BILA
MDFNVLLTTLWPRHLLLQTPLDKTESMVHRIQATSQNTDNPTFFPSPSYKHLRRDAVPKFYLATSI